MIGKCIVVLAVLALANARWHCEDRQCRRCGRDTQFPCRFPNYNNLNVCLENCECDLGQGDSQLPLYQCFRRRGRCQRCQPERTRCPGPVSILGESGGRRRALPTCNTRNSFYPTFNDCRRNCFQFPRDRPRSCFVRICPRLRVGRRSRNRFFGRRCRVVNRCRFRIGGRRGVTMEILTEDEAQGAVANSTLPVTAEGSEEELYAGFDNGDFAAEGGAAEGEDDGMGEDGMDGDLAAQGEDDGMGEDGMEGLGEGDLSEGVIVALNATAIVDEEKTGGLESDLTGLENQQIKSAKGMEA